MPDDNEETGPCEFGPEDVQSYDEEEEVRTEEPRPETQGKCPGMYTLGGHFDAQATKIIVINLKERKDRARPKRRWSI